KLMSHRSLSILKITASQIFRLAIDNRVMDYNPANKVTIPAKKAPSDRRALGAEEQAWITDTPHKAQCAAMVMMYAGLRRGELIALTWNDVNLKEGIIAVNKAVEFINGKPSLKAQTKTPAGIRTLEIPNRLIDFLLTQPHESIYVCVNSKGQMHTKSSWRRMWKSYLADLNIKYGNFSQFDNQPKSKFDPAGVPFVIPNITPHWLRHTFCTLLYFAGVDMLTAKTLMGHSNINTTMSIYSHLDALHKRKQASKLNDYLENTRQMLVNNN
ncbi:MAG: site-specific integrase, partial [Oscillospiraceae bacterium]|nr:site-specific integrase [Oscillospiraceae bacterium]